MIYQSDTLEKYGQVSSLSIDLIDSFLISSEGHNFKFYFGVYVSRKNCQAKRKFQKKVEINLKAAIYYNRYIFTHHTLVCPLSQEKN